MRRKTRAPDSSNERRLLVGLAVQPFVATAVAFFSFPVFLLDGNGQTLGGGRPADPTDAAVSVAIGAGLVALFVSVVGVLPTVLWLTRRFELSLIDTLLFGLGFATLSYAVTAIAAGGGTYGLAGLARGVAWSSLLGLAGATVFWAITLRRLECNQRHTGLDRNP
jgi:hypothetical protein